MRTTLDIPDALYREVRAKSALEGTTVRTITITLYTDWLSRGRQDNDGATAPASVTDELPAWAGLCEKAITRNAEGPHDMASIRRSIAKAKRVTAI